MVVSVSYVLLFPAVCDQLPPCNGVVALKTSSPVKGRLLLLDGLEMLLSQDELSPTRINSCFWFGGGIVRSDSLLGSKRGSSNSGSGIGNRTLWSEYVLDWLRRNRLGWCCTRAGTRAETCSRENGGLLLLNLFVLFVRYIGPTQLLDLLSSGNV